ncbi:MAG: hypothetical protein ACKVXR_05260 [Planctomycetota bacterium]
MITPLCMVVFAHFPAAEGMTRTSSVDPAKLAREYASAIEKLNDAQARKSEAKTEEDLAAKLPKEAKRALGSLIDVQKGPELSAALVTAGEAALDLALLDDFEKIRTKLEGLDQAATESLGIALSRPRFLARGTEGVEIEGLTAIADTLDLVLDAYDEVFGIKSFSKVPGKKLRLRAHLVEKIERPPHFAPQFPFHSEIDFPVIDAQAFRSPTEDGKFLFYGLCHELGHVVAMWGDRSKEEDHHSWAHYTGVVIVEHLAGKKPVAEVLAELKDVRWRSLEKERELIDRAKTKPSVDDAKGVMALLVQLHDVVGPKVIGEAVEAMSAEEKGIRINRVRYYRFKDFEEALIATERGKKKRKDVEKLFR